MESISQPEDPDPLPEFSPHEIPALEAYALDQREKLAGWQQYAEALENEECRFCSEECLCIKSEEQIAAGHIQRHEIQLRLANFTIQQLGDGRLY